MVVKIISGFKLLIPTTVVSVALLSAGQGGGGSCGETCGEAVSVKAVAENPEEYREKKVKLVGTLENEGKNYFTDLRVVLKDKEGHKVYVRPWLPVSLPPVPPNFKGKRPDVLSRYLGKQIELCGVIDRATLKNLGSVYVLAVESARVLP